MNDQIVLFWQSMLLVGQTALPYVGLVFLIVFSILVFVLTVYLLFRLGRRLPIFLRHLAWRCTTGFRRFWGWLRRDRSASQHTVMARFHANIMTAVPLQLSFSNGQRALPWAMAPIERPPEPLFLVLGFEGSGKSTLLSISGQAEATSAEQPASDCELTWWRLDSGWALEVNQTLCSAHHTPKFTHMLRILEQMCPVCPVDGLIVVLTAQQLLQQGADSQAVATLAGAAARIASQLGAALPVQMVISHANELQGFNALLQLRSAAGLSQATLGTHLPATAKGKSRQPTARLLREAVHGQILLALSMQAASSTNFELRKALKLPSEIDGLDAALQQFENQLSADSAATALPWLQSAVLTGFAPGTGSSRLGELVFAGPALRHQLFVKSVELAPRAAYQLECQRQNTYAAAMTVVGVASCLAILMWSSLTWTRMDQNLARAERLLNDIRPELHVAKNTSTALAASLGTDSLKRLLETVTALDQTTLAFALVPSSWFNDLRSEALQGVGEVMSITMIRARSEQLATDIPHASDAMLTPIGGVSAQRIEELPAYQDLLTFLDGRELLAVSMDSGQKLNKKISYAQFLSFMGSKPEQLKLNKVDLSDAMPLEVTQRFSVEVLQSPEITAALRQTIDSYWERIVSEALDQHPMVLLSEEVQDGMLSAASGVFAIPEAQQLNDSLKRLKRESELPSSRRIFGSKKDGLLFFAKAQRRLGLSTVVPSGQMVELAALLEKRFENLRTTMLQKESEGVGLLFTADVREGSMQLSPEIKRLSSAYTSYMSQPFMRPAGKTQIKTPSNGQYLEWKLTEVEPARILAESLRDYSTGGSLAFDARIQSGLMRLARSNYQHQVDALFSNATHQIEQSPARNQTLAEASRQHGSANLRQLASRAANLAAAGKLYRLLQPPNNATNPRSAVSDQLIRESSLLLEQFEDELYKEDSYASLIAGVASWLRNPPNEKMLAGSFKGNTKERLVSSREYVRLRYGLAVLPLLEYLTAEASRVSTNDVVLRWTRLRETIDAYEKGNVSNGIYELERYVLALAKLRDANECVGFLEERQLPVQRGDYFSQQLITLDEAVANACEQRITQAQQRNYENFANWFNTTIAGRPPFSNNGWQSSHAALAVPLFESMLSRYSEFRQPMLGDKKEREIWPTDIGLFIAKMDQLAAYFLAPQNANKTVASTLSGTAKRPIRSEGVRSDLPFRALLEFRTGRMYEAGADQIIEWSVSSGGRRYTSRGNELLQWKMGDPVEVQLRWAANSPMSPLALVSKIYNYSAGERTASFKYSGDWALFELLAKHKFSTVDTDRGVALLFEIPTLGPKGRQDTKAFITMLSPGGINTLTPDFPALAPMFVRQGSN